MARFVFPAVAFFVLAACSPTQPLGPDFVELRGRVDSHMGDKVRTALQRGQRDFTIDSPGGYVVTAILVGAEIDRAGGSMTVVGPCQSACSLMLMAVKRRYIAAGGFVEVHASNQGGLATAYSTLGMPPAVAAHADSLNLRRLTANELAESGFGFR